MRHCVQHTDRRVCVSCDDPTVGGTVMFLSVGIQPVWLMEINSMFSICFVSDHLRIKVMNEPVFRRSGGIQLVCSYAVYLETHLAVKNQT